MPTVYLKKDSGGKVLLAGGKVATGAGCCCEGGCADAFTHVAISAVGSGHVVCDTEGDPKPYMEYDTSASDSYDLSPSGTIGSCEFTLPDLSGGGTATCGGGSGCRESMIDPTAAVSITGISGTLDAGVWSFRFDYISGSGLARCYSLCCDDSQDALNGYIEDFIAEGDLIGTHIYTIDDDPQHLLTVTITFS